MHCFNKSLLTEYPGKLPKYPEKFGASIKGIRMIPQGERFDYCALKDLIMPRALLFFSFSPGGSESDSVNGSVGPPYISS